MSISHERDLRQREFVPPERLAQSTCVVIGVGAIGRQVALQLAAMGVSRLVLYDQDHVSVENLATQGYWPEDLSQPKATVTSSLCHRMNPTIELVAVTERFRRHNTSGLDYTCAVFVCVDCIVTRRLIWEAVGQQVGLLVDGRLLGEVMRILASDQQTPADQYPSTLFAREQAQVGRCTARSTIYSASIAAGMMVAQWTRWLRQIPVLPDQTLHLLSSELIS